MTGTECERRSQSAHKRRAAKIWHETCCRSNGGKHCCLVDLCQCRKPPEAVAEGQHLRGATRQSESVTEVGGGCMRRRPFRLPCSPRMNYAPFMRGFSPPPTLSNSPGIKRLQMPERHTDRSRRVSSSSTVVRTVQSNSSLRRHSCHMSLNTRKPVRALSNEGNPNFSYFNRHLFGPRHRDS